MPTWCDLPAPALASQNLGVTREQVPVLVVPEQASQLAGKDVVLVDDIVGSGETLHAVRSALAAFHPHRLRTAFYLVNLTHWEATHRCPPEQEITYIGQTIRAWAVFPWKELPALARDPGKGSRRR